MIMEEKNSKNTNVIDLRIIVKKIWRKRRLFYKVWAATFVLSAIYIVGIPRYYTTEARVAPELENSISGGTLGSIASSFGFDLNNMQTNDAIYPQLYPDLMEDNKFVTNLFNIKVISQDGEINTNYHDYLKKHQKRSVWSYPTSWISSLFKSKKKTTGGGKGASDPYELSEDENNVAEAIRANIQFGFNEKTGVITIKTKAQDAKICRTLADSVMEHLQDFITAYRTNKARIDYEYYKQLATKAKQDYEKVRRQYGSLSDANTNVKLHSVELQLQDMENEMQLKFNSYTTVSAQLEAAKAKVQERTPAFTLLKGASVPIKPAGPKRMLFVFFMLVLATIICSIVVLRDDIVKIIELREKNNQR